MRSENIIAEQMLAKEFEAKKEDQQSKQIAVDGKNFESEDKRQAALRFQEQCHLC